MASQQAKTFVLLTLCCTELVISKSSNQGQFKERISSSDFFPDIEDYYVKGETIQIEDGLKDFSQIVTSKLAVYCTNDTIKVKLPSGSLSQVKILGFSVIESVLDAPATCGYSLTRGQRHNILLVKYTGCHVTLEEGGYTLRVLYPNEAGQLDFATLSCDTNQSLAASQKQHHLQSDEKSKCVKQPPQQFPQPQPPQQFPRPQPPQQFPRPQPPQQFPRPQPPQQFPRPQPPQQFPRPQPPQQFPRPQPPQQFPQPQQPPPQPPQLNLLPLSNKPGGCSIPINQRVMCSTPGISSGQCVAKGCCVDVMTSACYYPMDECTADKYFVFAVYHDFTNLPVNPMSLMVAGKTGCKPVISNQDFAIFRFSVTECGTRSFVIGETTIYLAEVQTVIKAHNLKYGIISRDNPVRLMVECRYPKILKTPVLASAGYMVMSPNLPPYLLSEGLFGVQLRISEDKTFTRFYPQYHQPLYVLLGKPVYLEVRLKSPKPDATLVVHYCVAYPRSAKSALVLLFEGCPNPLDSGSASVLYVKDLPQNRHQRRFEIRAFQFMDQSTNKYLNEEIYFMCSTEVCMPSGSPCAEACFDGKSQ